MQDILKLKNSGICTILGVAQTTRKNLLKIKVCPFHRWKGAELMALICLDRGCLRCVTLHPVRVEQYTN